MSPSAENVAPKVLVRIFKKQVVNGAECPPHRILVEVVAGVTCTCDLWLSAADLRRFDIAEIDLLNVTKDERGVLPIIELLEWELDGDELAAIDLFTKRGVVIELPDVSDAALKLAMMRNALGMELSLARGPVFADERSVAPDPNQLTLWREVGQLHGRAFKVFEPAGPLHERDGLLIGHMTRLYMDADFPDNRRFLLTFGEAAKAAGYTTKGGRQRQLVKEALDRMVITTFKAATRTEDGDIEELTFHICDWTLTSTRDGGSAVVTFSEPFAGQIRAGRLAYLERATYARLMDADGKAARLWTFLEAESLPTPRLYSLFARKDGRPRDTPAIADLLRIARWSNRTRIWQRVQQACDVIMSIDQKYRLEVVPGAGAARPKMWNLRASRSGSSLGPEVGTPSKDGGYSQLDKWVLPVREVGTPSKGQVGKSLQNGPVSDSAVSSSVSSSVSNTVKGKRDAVSKGKGPKQEQESEAERPCTYTKLTEALDPRHLLRDVVSEKLIEALAATVCQQVVKASAGVCCMDPENCEATQAMGEVGDKLAHKFQGGGVKNPPAYVQRMIANANADPGELLGAKRADADHRLERLRWLARSRTVATDDPVRVLATKAVKRMDDAPVPRPGAPLTQKYLEDMFGE